MLNLVNASEGDLKMISTAEKIDANFLEMVANIVDNSEACTVCGHAFHGWRNTLEDEIVPSFIDDWINWETQTSNPAQRPPRRNRKYNMYRLWYKISGRLFLD